MNRILTGGRNRMNRLLFISVNRARVASCAARRFAEMWVKEGRHAADEPSKEAEKEDRNDCFLVQSYTAAYVF